MPTDLSKYASNQFEVATRGSNILLSEILADTRPRLAQAATDHSEFSPDLIDLDNIIALWNAAEIATTNAEATLKSRTLAFDDKRASLTRQPDVNTASPIAIWDTTILGQTPEGSPLYVLLLPQGRATITNGTHDQWLDALASFAIRLNAQVAKPVLVTLGNTVGIFANAARFLRSQQEDAKAALDAERRAQDDVRADACAILYGMVGTGIHLWRDTPELVDTLFDINLLRGPAQTIPTPPLDTQWTPAQRRLSTTALPEGATRLEAWREGPGGAPELLAIGDPDTLEVIIPANIVFDSGDLYQLWLQARNSRGSSEPGPKQSWTAP